MELASPAAAQPERIAGLEVGLASATASDRATAIASYASLGTSDVEEITARMRALRRRAGDPVEVTRVVTSFRHAVGSRRADDAVDIAPGVALVLESAHDALTVRLAALVLLERAAETIGTREALACVTELAAWPGDGIRLEARRIAARLDARLAATVIDARSHEVREARQWAEWAGGRLGLDEPGRFVSGLDPELVPDVLRAFARGHVMSAVPVVASFVDAPRTSTRAAAREALGIYGQNSIWVARDALRVRTGETPDLTWGWRRTLDALFASIDAAHDEIVEADLARATDAIAAGDRDAAHASLEAVLRRVPSPTSAATGAALVRLADLDVAADDLASARAHLTIASRLPVDASDAPRRDALLALVRAETRLGAGVLDADGYARAATADASCERCAALHERFLERAPGAAGPAPARLLAAAVAFLVLALLLWPSRSRGARSAIEASDVEPTAGIDDDAADATLPG